jgi:tetratricopeptide (TPR) repeat protein/two-component sensor histidine kinase
MKPLIQAIERRTSVLALLCAALFSSCHHTTEATTEQDALVAYYDSLSYETPDEAERQIYARLDSMDVTADDSLLYHRLLQSLVLVASRNNEAARGDSLLNTVRGYCDRRKCSQSVALQELSYRNYASTAIFANRFGQDERSLQYFQKSEEEAYRCALSNRYKDVAINIADLYIVLNRLPEAASTLRHGLFLCDSLHLSVTEKIPFYNALSAIYLRLGDDQSALRYSDQALQFVEGASALDRFNCWSYRGNVFYAREEYDSAHDYFERCIDLGLREQISEYNMNIARLNLVDLHTLMGDYDGLEATIDSCRSYFDVHDLETCNYYLTTICARLNLLRDDDPQSAVQLMNHSQYSTPSDYLRNMRNELLRECFIRIGQKDSVLRMDRLLLNYRDSLINDIAAMRVADIELQYKENIREYQHEELRRTLEIRIYLYILLVIVLLLVVAVALILYYNARRMRALERERLSNSLLLEKVRNLRQRLSPHYLMNLASLLGRTEVHSSEDAIAIASTLRHSLELSSRIVVTLSEELSFVEDYAKMLPRVGNIQIRREIDPDLDPDRVQILGMSLQMPLENAAKYAYPMDGEYIVDPVICIAAHRAKRGAHPGVEISVEDFGVGLPADTPLRKSQGYTVLLRTISYLNLHNSVPIDLQIRNKAVVGEGHGLKVTFFFPDGYDYGE